MFEREIQFIYDFSHNKIKQLGSFITFSELQATNLHPAILQYISAEIDFYIFEDRQKLLKDSLFDYSGNKISSYFSLISEEIKKTKKFSQSYIEKLILHSVTFTINHLVTPNSLTTQFIFEEDNQKSATEIKQILNYMYYYPHTKKIIASYLDKKNVMKITSEEFIELLKKIDNISFTDSPGKNYDEVLESMADFFNVGMTGRSMVPLMAVQNYLKDKGLKVHLDKLKSEFVDAEITRYEIKDYRKVLLLTVAEPETTPPEDEDKTEEVLESELDDNKMKPHFFHPVDEGESEGNSEVDLKINREDSTKVILDDETVEEIKDDVEAQDITPEKEVTEEPAADESAANEQPEIEAVSGQEIDAAQGPVEDDKPVAEPVNDIMTSDAPEASEQEDISQKVDPEMIEIEDDVEAEPETVAEILELAKEEVSIESGEKIEDELVVEEEDDSLKVLDENELESDTDQPEPEPAVSTDLDDVPAAGEETAEMQGEFEVLEDQIGFNSSKEDPIEFEEAPAEETEKKDAASSDIENDEIEDIPEITSEDTLSFLLEEEAEEPDASSPAGTDAIDSMMESKGKENIPEEQGLFKNMEEDKEEISPQTENIRTPEKEPVQPKQQHIDITSLLENKKITKVIDAIFDYDMEEFANVIEKISEAPNLDTANQIIDKACNASQIPASSKEAKLFKSIISDYYDRK